MAFFINLFLGLLAALLVLWILGEIKVVRPLAVIMAVAAGFIVFFMNFAIKMI